jgi:triphosphoribosyl-dephospho-CoA synthase
MMTPGGMRKEVERVMQGTTAKDAVNVYEAISVARPGSLRPVAELDVNTETSRDEIIRRNISLYRILEMSSSWDNISKELVTGMRVTFEVGHPTFVDTVEQTRDINIATVHTFLTILSKEMDSLVVRKKGESVARDLCQRAKEILDAGGLTTGKGKKMTQNLDEELSKQGNKLNPGTTADLTCSSIMVALLEGWRP